MSKNSSRADAAARAAKMRAEAAKKDRQRRQLLAAGVAVVVVVIGVVIALVVSNAKPKDTSEAGGSSDNNAFLQTIAALPPAAFDAAGRPESANSIPKKLDGQAPLKDGEKAKVIYVGGEFCPYCATERWSLVAALSRFGTFEGLKPTRSAENDGNIPTVTFVGSKYTSDYVTFTPFETMDRAGGKLQELPKDVEDLFGKFVAPPYVDAQSTGSIPWTFFGDAQVSGSGVPVQAFTKDLSDGTAWATIADQMKTGTGQYGKPIMAHANVLTAQICRTTNNQPANVCTSPAVVQASALLQK